MGWGLAELGFGPDRIRTLVSMASDSPHRVLMGKPCDHSSSFIFDWFLFILAGNEDNHNILDGSKFGKIGPGTYELAAIGCLEKLIMGEIL